MKNAESLGAVHTHTHTHTSNLIKKIIKHRRKAMCFKQNKIWLRIHSFIVCKKLK